MAKAQLRVLLGMQAMSTKVIETCTKLLSHHVNCVEGQLESLSKYIARDVDLGQSTLGKVRLFISSDQKWLRKPDHYPP